MLLRVSSSLSGSRHAVTTDIILAGHAPGVPSGHHLLADIVSAPIAASAGERTHVTVRIAVLYLQLVSIRTTHAVRAQVEVAILLARVVTTACCNLEVRSAPITDQACAARSVDMALGIAPLLLLPGPVEDERVILTACCVLSCIVFWAGQSQTFNGFGILEGLFLDHTEMLLSLCLSQ